MHVWFYVNFVYFCGSKTTDTAKTLQRVLYEYLQILKSVCLFVCLFVCLCIYYCVSVCRSGLVTRVAGAKVTPLRTSHCWRRVCAVRSTKRRTSRKWKSCTHETAKNRTKSTASPRVKVLTTQTSLSALRWCMQSLNQTFSTLLFCLFIPFYSIAFIYLYLPSQLNHLLSCWTPSVLFLLSLQAFPLKFSPKSSLSFPVYENLSPVSTSFTQAGDLLYAIYVTRYVSLSVCLYICQCVCLSVRMCLCVCLCVCIVNARSSNRRAVTGWAMSRQSSSSSSSSRRPRPRHHRHHPATTTAASGGDVIDDDVMDDDGLPFFSMPADIKPPDWFLTSVSSYLGCYF